MNLLVVQDPETIAARPSCHAATSSDLSRLLIHGRRVSGPVRTACHMDSEVDMPFDLKTGYGPAALRTLAVTLRSASLVPFGHASRRLSSGFARRRGRGANQPEVRGRKGWARLARLARQRDSDMDSHIGILHAASAASPLALRRNRTIVL